MGGLKSIKSGQFCLAVLLDTLVDALAEGVVDDAVLGWSPKAGRFVEVENHRSARTIPGIVV